MPPRWIALAVALSPGLCSCGSQSPASQTAPSEGGTMGDGGTILPGDSSDGSMPGTGDDGTVAGDGGAPADCPASDVGNTPLGTDTPDPTGTAVGAITYTGV